jgi:hypothetical protein
LNTLSNDTKYSIAHACTSRRLGVTTREAGWLLSQGESTIRRLVRRGLLVHAVAPTLISVASLRVCLPDDELRPLREAALDALLNGRLRVPAPPTRYARPAPITNLARYLTTTPLDHRTADVRS